MTPEERQAWLDGLKSGDRVAFPGRGWEKDYKLDTVKHRTPTGQIVLAGGRRFRPDGSEITSSTWDKTSLFPVTDDLLARMDARRRRRVVVGTNWEEMPQEVIDAVYPILEAEREAMTDG